MKKEKKELNLEFQATVGELASKWPKGTKLNHGGVLYEATGNIYPLAPPLSMERFASVELREV